MDMAAVEIINVVGFPIAVCIALFWFNNQMIKDNRQTENEFRLVLQRNTEVMVELINLIKENRNDL
jgi:uncharacterized protein YcfL